MVKCARERENLHIARAGGFKSCGRNRFLKGPRRGSVFSAIETL